MQHLNAFANIYEIRRYRKEEDYLDTCLATASELMGRYGSIAAIEKASEEINAYSNRIFLSSPKNLAVLEPEALSGDDRKRAIKLLLEGKVFTEHAFAGEATRLGLGAKYLINIREQLTLNRIADMMQAETGTTINAAHLRAEIGFDTAGLLPISLGTRRMLQFSFELSRLARLHGRSPDSVLEAQKMLVVLNANSADRIIRDFIANRFFGFSREHVFFMIQTAYHGIGVRMGRMQYNRFSPRRLHNHGQIAIQQTLPDQIFRITSNDRRVFIGRKTFADLLSIMVDKVACNVEDLTFLVNAVDIDGIAYALKKGDQGFHMLMEVIENNPLHPQKGGMAAHDPILGRDVMIESFQLGGMPDERIYYLNKNVNHYPQPYRSWTAVAEAGLPLHVAVKHDHLYFQPVQGDISHLLRTGFYTRKPVQQIKAWKSSVTTPLAMQYMQWQDSQTGFLDFAESLMRKPLRSL